MSGFGDGDSGAASARRLAPLLALVLLLAFALRVAFPLADPPWREPIGITWHDEGVWAHNARNKALWGGWRQDEWNPMFVSPVFTGLEYLVFAVAGVGLWQARLVSMIAGALSVLGLAIGLRARADRAPAAAAGALLLAVNYTWVMYGRVALLEAAMVALLVAAWAWYARARSWQGGLAAGLLALLAFFTKASAAFFLVALGLDCLWTLAPAWRRGRWTPVGPAEVTAAATLGTLAAGTALAIAIFVAPYWDEYAFYNLQVYGARRAAPGLDALVDRASWFPVIHGFFTRHWLLTAAAFAGALRIVCRHKQSLPGDRLLVLWLVLGSAELVMHDLGNERRYVFLIPPMAALAALLLVEARELAPAWLTGGPRGRLLRVLPLVLPGAYVLAGSVSRTFFLPDISLSVRTGAAAAAVLTLAVVAGWPRLAPVLRRARWSAAAAWLAVAVIAAGDLARFARWAAGRTYRNYEASLAVGRVLPAGTPVQGKLANGLALDNRIRPLFIGPGFGNFADRHDRPDVQWILTYDRPRLGYEGAVIREVLEALPGWTVELSFPVAETPGGDDRAVLIRKRER
ncbi:MAG TPA: glycosyltransferase family 39 protein [Methylomirabilota bacterium]